MVVNQTDYHQPNNPKFLTSQDLNSSSNNGQTEKKRCNTDYVAKQGEQEEMNEQ